MYPPIAMASGGGLAEKFKAFATKADGKEMTTADFTKWCKDAAVFGKTCNSNHVDIAFAKVKPKASKFVASPSSNSFRTSFVLLQCFLRISSVLSSLLRPTPVYPQYFLHIPSFSPSYSLNTLLLYFFLCISSLLPSHSSIFIDSFVTSFKFVHYFFRITSLIPTTFFFRLTTSFLSTPHPRSAFPSPLYLSLLPFHPPSLPPSFHSNNHSPLR